MDKYNEIFYSIALTQCQGIGRLAAKRLVEAVGSPSAVFANRNNLQDIIPDLHPRVITALDNAEALSRAETEMAFIQKNGIKCFLIGDEAYPSRLRECDDAPVVLFQRGDADLNNLHIVAMVGTRHATEYGRQFCSSFIEGLASLCPGTLVVSGLAYGIDICSHRSALQQSLPTVAVLAHGLDRIYPSVHSRTALEMVSNGGGLLTEYLSGTNPDAFNFVNRNRIVAGMCDATVVVESAQKGGSLITASLANGYNRDCFAVPGSVWSDSSAGCNSLIRDNKAALISDAADFVEAMGWGATAGTKKQNPVQRELFVELTDAERLVVDALRKQGDMHINALTVATDIPVNRMAGMLFEMEMKGVVKALVGGVYHLVP